MSLALWDDTLAELAVGGHSTPADRHGRLRLRREDGTWEIVAVDAWHGPLDRCDRMLLSGLRSAPGAVLDVGCGPGRLAAAAQAQELPSLGIDVAPAAVRLARARGAVAELASIFDELPDPGPWRHILLIDGNVGIGGCPRALLRRCRELLTPDGLVHVEVGPPGSGDRSIRVRLELGTASHGDWFRWAEVSVGGLRTTAHAAGLMVRRVWTSDGRWFGELARRPL